MKIKNLHIEDKMDPTMIANYITAEEFFENVKKKSKETYREQFLQNQQ